MDKVNFSLEKKRKFLEDALEGDHAFITFDATLDEVQVPESLKTSPMARLKLSYRFRGATDVNKDGITAELLFDGTYFTCVVPWGAIWCITTEAGEDKVWKEDIPKQATLLAAKQKIQSLLFKKKREETPIESTEPEGKKSDESKKPPFLRVVK